MSFDIAWSALDAGLTASVVEFLTGAFASAQRPSYLGQVTVTSFSFGDAQPAVQLLDLSDIHHEFLDADEEEEQLARNAAAAARTGPHWEGEPKPVRTGQPRSGLQHGSTLFAPALPHSLASGYSSYRSSSLDRPPYAESSNHLSAAPSSFQPSLQLHLQVTYTGNMHIGLATSLLVNFPSPLFMSLPLKLAVTSLAFSGTFIVAYEGDRRRVHLSILDPKEAEDGNDTSQWTFESPTAGARILSSAVVESEVGQSDKHVLKNVGKVEKFVVDVMRTTLENEIVFPCVRSSRCVGTEDVRRNFQTVMF